MNDMSDEDYEQALRNIKLVSNMFFNSNATANVFHVLAEALKYILSQRDDPVPEPPEEEVDEFEEMDEDELSVWDDLINPLDDDDDGDD